MSFNHNRKKSRPSLPLNIVEEVGYLVEKHVDLAFVHSRLAAAQVWLPHHRLLFGRVHALTEAELLHTGVTVLVLVKFEEEWLILVRLDQIQKDFGLHFV